MEMVRAESFLVKFDHVENDSHMIYKRGGIVHVTRRYESGHVVSVSRLESFNVPIKVRANVSYSSVYRQRLSLRALTIMWKGQPCQPISLLPS